MKRAMMVAALAVAACAVPVHADAEPASCSPSGAHPRPVVLVHGTWVDGPDTWSTLAPQLGAEGYCVFTLEYGYRADPGSNLLQTYGGDDIAASSRELATFVDDVRGRTGAEQVDIVGHSQGGVVARQYLKFDGGADAVHTLVTLGATNHGTTFSAGQLIGSLAEQFGLPVGEVAAAAVGPSFVQQMVGSNFLGALNADGDTVPGVDYTVIATRSDTVSTPPENTFLTAGPGASVDNVWVQDGCPQNTATHMELTSDPRAVWMIQRGLDRSYADRVPSPC
ncbi:lipase [Rhodococcus sp. Leaf7]|uniref:esterase/lipase family protein n=1 Tax=unclassified Rhodococcus (in: high G+C Gram-positive bacteria) TaxID=192944 RepID=UPI0006F60066|nr:MULTISPECIES: alpha/beta fold hydrolase [unclassified Rhodococcus (in: high G+C Gram-positive bacteria)]KQU07434.1 lipase [Rhodococcus sp. Leaf7]KQU42954.1 lipase [Rhodococcus sp. Leaf247]